MLLNSSFNYNNGTGAAVNIRKVIRGGAKLKQGIITTPKPKGESTLTKTIKSPTTSMRKFMSVQAVNPFYAATTLAASLNAAQVNSNNNSASSFKP